MDLEKNKKVFFVLQIEWNQSLVDLTRSFILTYTIRVWFIDIRIDTIKLCLKNCVGIQRTFEEREKWITVMRLLIVPNWLINQNFFSQSPNIFYEISESPLFAL